MRHLFKYVTRQRNVYEYAKQKNYYQPAAPANSTIVQQLKNQLQQG